jgi:hypothetical protein
VSDSSTVTRRRVAAWLETDRGAALATFGAAFVVYALTASWTRIHNSDVYASVVPAIQAAQTGTVWLEGTPWADTSPFFDRVGDHVVSNRQVGIIMLAVPFYALFGAPDDVWPSVLAVVAAAAGTVTMLHLSVRRYMSHTAAWAAIAVLALGTPTWTVSADGLWSHTVTQLAIAAAAVALANERWSWAGVALGAGILARPHLAVIALVVGLGLAWSQRRWRTVLAVGLPAAIWMAMLAVLNRWIYDRWTVTGYDSYTTTNLVQGQEGAWYDPLVNVLGFLVAPDRGLFVWTPIALVLLPTVWRIRRSVPVWTVWLALGGVAYSLVQLRINHFHGVDAFFGYRHALELVTCAFPLYAIAWSRARPLAKGVAAGLAVVQVAAMALGSVKSDGFLSADDVWTDNSMLYVMRLEPWVMAPLYAVILVLATRLGVRVYLRSREDSASYQT